MNERKQEVIHYILAKGEHDAIRIARERLIKQGQLPEGPLTWNVQQQEWNPIHCMYEYDVWCFQRPPAQAGKEEANG